MVTIIAKEDQLDKDGNKIGQYITFRFFIQDKWQELKYNTNEVQRLINKIQAEKDNLTAKTDFLEEIKLEFD